MPTAAMDNTTSPLLSERILYLLKENTELENELRNSEKSKIPSDENVWRKIRDNYVSILLEDSASSVQLEVELSLWQLHYRKIERFRGHVPSNIRPDGSALSEGGEFVVQSDRVGKMRTSFNFFLSEATEFYLELMQKIRSKFQLPIGYIPENQVISRNGDKMSAELKKGLFSCHQCLIYLGDLARYKFLYKDMEPSISHHEIASSYYKQATNLWPFSGNPHHQLAILSSYSDDTLNGVYRYFRSLAVDVPFSTARDNLIILFEKNRQFFLNLPSAPKVPTVKIAATRMNGRGRGRGRGRCRARGRGENNTLSKDASLGHPSRNDGSMSCVNIPELFNAFSTRFIRLNGILFTRTSLETFEDIFSLVISDLNQLLSSGPKEVLSFGSDVAENAFHFLQFITILIFTVHNVNMNFKGKVYTEVLQRNVLLQSAFVAAFEFAGHIVKRCTQLLDISSSYMLPSIMVFVEWLACNPYAVLGKSDERQSTACSFFWNNFVDLMNKLLLSGLVSFDENEDEVCFSNMAGIEGETENSMLALWEDFELRGFSPLAASQIFLDYSSKYSHASGLHENEKRLRIQRIFSAVRFLLHNVRVDQKALYFDSIQKKFIFTPEFPTHEAEMQGDFGLSKSNSVSHQVFVDSTLDFKHAQSNTTSPLEELDNEEEEVIVFEPVAERRKHAIPRSSVIHDPIHTVQSFADTFTTITFDEQHSALNSHSPVHTPVISCSQSTADTHVGDDSISHPIQNGNDFTSKWFMEQERITNDIKTENGNGVMNGPSDFFSMQPSSLLHPFSQLTNANVSSGMSYGQINEYNFDPILPPPGRINEDIVISLPSSKNLNPMNIRKNPVARPVKHSGPPPGFSSVQPKQPNYPCSSLFVKDQKPLRDGYEKSRAQLKKGMVTPIQVGMENESCRLLVENLRLYTRNQFQINQIDSPILEQHQAQRPNGYYF